MRYILGHALIATLSYGLVVGAPVTWRDSIGTDNSTTNGNQPFQSTYFTETQYAMTLANSLLADNDLVLRQVRAIAAPLTSAGDLSQMDFVVRIWRNPGIAIGSPNYGNIANLYFDAPVYAPTPYGMTGRGNGDIGVRTTYELVFDLAPYQIQVPEGESRVLGIQFVAPDGTLSNGYWGWMESTEEAPSDEGVATDIPGGYDYLEYFAQSDYFGRQAFEVLADSLELGDATGDGRVTGADYTVWSDHFGEGPWVSGFDGDFNNDLYVTGADFNIWADNFGNDYVESVPEPWAFQMTAVIVAWLASVGRRTMRRTVSVRAAT